MSTPTTPTVSAPPVLMTADEFTARYDHIHAELVKGVVKEYPVPWPKHGKICATIARLIGNHVEANDLGHVRSNDSWIRTGSNPDTVRGGDVCFFSYERLPKGDVPEGLLPVVPDLVVEVRSPSDRWPDILDTISEYLNAGAWVVVFVDTGMASVTVYRLLESPQTRHNSDELTIPDVLPGFTVTFNRLFA